MRSTKCSPLLLPSQAQTPPSAFSTALYNILSACSFLTLRDQISQATSQEAKFVYVHVIRTYSSWRNCGLNVLQRKVLTHKFPIQNCPQALCFPYHILLAPWRCKRYLLHNFEISPIYFLTCLIHNQLNSTHNFTPIWPRCMLIQLLNPRFNSPKWSLPFVYSNQNFARTSHFPYELQFYPYHRPWFRQPKNATWIKKCVGMGMLPYTFMTFIAGLFIWCVCSVPNSGL